MTVKLLIENHLEILSFKGGYTGSSESTYVKIPHCWKSHVAAQLFMVLVLLRKITIVAGAACTPGAVISKQAFVSAFVCIMNMINEGSDETVHACRLIQSALVTYDVSMCIKTLFAG